MNSKQRVVVGISGASGAALGVRAVELLAEAGHEVQLVVSRSAERTLAHEVGPEALRHLAGLAHQFHPIDDVGASIASGSFRTAGMIVAPCSIRTLSAVAASAADNLLVRAADVHLKERRRLVLLVRESPLHLGHIRAMAQVTEIGAIVAPPVPAFYHLPRTVQEAVDHIARRAVGLLDLHTPATAGLEWTGCRPEPADPAASPAPKQQRGAGCADGRRAGNAEEDRRQKSPAASDTGVGDT